LADEVIIGNVGGQDGVASEATLQALVRAVERMGNQRGQKGTGDKTQQLANKAIAAGTTATNTQTTATQDQTTATKQTTQAAQNLARGLGALAARGVGQVLASLGALTKEVIGGSSNVADFAAHIPIAGSLFAALGRYMDESMASFKQLSMSGASFNNDLLELRRTSADLNLNLDEFTNIVGRNTEKFAAIGGTATQGVQRIAQLNKALGEQREQLQAMGFSQEQIVEALTDYAYLTRAGSRTEKLSQQQQAEQAQAAAGYAKNLQTLSKLTGEDVKSMQEKIAAQQNDVAFQMRVARLAPAEREKVLAGMAEAMAMGGQTGADYFKQQFLGLPPLTRETQLFQATMGESAKVIADMSRSAQNTNVSLQQFNAGQVDRLVNFVEGAANSGQRLESVLATASAGMDGPGKEIAAILQGMGKQFTDYQRMENGRLVFDREALRRDVEAARREQNNRSASTQSMASFDKSLRDLRAALQKAFIDSGVLDLFVKGISFFAELLGTAAKEVTAFFTKIKEGDILGAIGSIFTGSAATLAIVGGITALFLGKAALNAMTTAVGGLASRMAGSLFGGGGAAAGGAARGAAAGGAAAAGGGAMASAGKTIGDFGKGIGKGIEGVLKGLAKGVSAFANPLFLVGAAKLSLGIVLVGGAVAGATWMLGKALPTFAEGMKAFGDIDGSNLIKVGVGIGAVGLALAGMAAGSVAGAVGNVLANLIELLPGRTLLDRLKEFQGMDLNSDKVKANSDAVVAYSNAMSALGTGGTVGAIGGLVRAAAEGLTSFFGGEVRVPWDKVQAFQSITLDANKIKANSEAVTAFGQAMSNLPSINGERSGGLIGAVADFFVGAEREQVPWAQMVAFGNLRLPTASIKANAEAMAAFGEALNKLPNVQRGRSGGLIGMAADFFLGAEREQIPWAQMVAFGQYNLPAGAIKTNAEAMAAFGEALSKLPEVKRERTGGLMGAVSSFFLGGQQDVIPWAQMVAFGQLQLPTASIKANAEAMAAFGEALSKVPVVDRARSGGIMESITSFFAGSRSGPLPWENLAAFGQLRIDATSVKNNAEAMTAFGNALTAFRGTGGGSGTPPTISQELIASLGRLSAIGTNGGLQATATGLQAIANVQNLQTTLSSLNALDATKLTSYNTALRDLTRTLADLNKELSNENRSGLFGMGDSRANAGEILKNISVNTSAGAGNTGQLNETLMRVIEVLQQTKEINDKIEKNTKRGSGSDVANRDVTSF
jgi:hypothetical protein